MTPSQEVKVLKEIVALKNEEIELLLEIIAKPEIIGSIRSLEYLHRRLDINKKQIELEAKL
jgi:hypothetical protein